MRTHFLIIFWNIKVVIPSEIQEFNDYSVLDLRGPLLVIPNKVEADEILLHALRRALTRRDEDATGNSSSIKAICSSSAL